MLALNKLQLLTLKSPLGISPKVYIQRGDCQCGAQAKGLPASGCQAGCVEPCVSRVLLREACPQDQGVSLSLLQFFSFSLPALPLPTLISYFYGALNGPR